MTAADRTRAKLPYRIEGNPRGPALVLLNGLFADYTSWDGAMAHLEDYHVLRYDGRGQGDAPKPPGPYGPEVLVADLKDLLDALDWPPTALLGISNGGRLALAFAAAYPERVRAVVAVGCYAAPTRLLRLKLSSWLAAHRVGGPEHRFDVAAPWIWSEAALSLGADLVQMYRSRAALLDPTAVEGLIEGAMCGDVDLTAIQAPTLLAAGEDDLLTPPAEHRDLAAMLAHGQFATLPGAHAGLLERPDLVREHILPFLRAQGTIGEATTPARGDTCHVG
ncbi:Alpha/beta fold hydrolase [Sulfidibacter corallicola]|uniref:Alpha/beta fold hydrolase n=1 Tax=Sulfidibacter corallicola TaxID=2818388 RepID=A0A8A4TKC4_SULCO|nr:alpha/beta fold hydrolase [Sulfidibacter corallicola]QTD50033.1 alpha/beta fold hydrolase [Sulfidibacter corallicola]